MLKKMNKYFHNSTIENILREISENLNKLEHKPSFQQAKSTINTIIDLLGLQGEWETFSDDRRRIYNKANWFHLAESFRDRRATYIIADKNEKNIDLKAFWVKQKSKSILSWIVALTPNFEDAPYNSKYNIGIDFIIPNEADSFLVILSKNHILRALELKGHLGPTQKEILSKWINVEFSNKTLLHKTLWESFDLQPINKEFYKGICKHFYQLRAFLCEEKKFSELEANLFTVKLIGRILFCWFLDKKGLIKDSISYFRPHRKQTDKDFYNEFLCYLFFNLLDTPIKNRKKEDKTKAPYLNGGLFFKNTDDKYNPYSLEGYKSKLDFPKGFFNSFYNFLKSYNFTTDESTSSFQQVAIDPEMLGKIFENLLAEQREETGVQARKAKGAYYTPREIVDYMCKESLRAYLKNKLPQNNKVDDCLKMLLDTNWGEFNDQKSNYQRDYLKEYKSVILSSLKDIKVLDPACGSGAFPMGIIHIMLQIYERLESNRLRKRKMNIIQNNIYGVDIDPMAIEIAKLRVWLSLIIESTSNNIRELTLPNLEFKFICADTLVQSSDKNMKVDEELKKLTDSYFSYDRRKRKERLQKEITQKLNVLQPSNQKITPFNYSKNCDFFNPKIMFGLRDGFDIIIGNPPYGVKFKPSLKNYLKNIYPKVPDRESAYYFIQIGKKFLKGKGILYFIIQNTLLFNTFAENFRKDIVPYLRSIIDLSSSKIFSIAVRNILISVAKEHIKERKVSLGNNLKKNFAILSQRELLKRSKNWQELFFTNEDRIFLQKVDSNSEKLSVYCEVKQGIKPYDKHQRKKVKKGSSLKGWEIDKEKEGFCYLKQRESTIKNKIFHSKEKKDRTYKPLLKGKDISCGFINWNSNRYISYGNWLANPVKKRFFNGRRIVFREILDTSRILGFLVNEEYYHDPQIIVAKPFREKGLDEDEMIFICSAAVSEITFRYFSLCAPKSKKGLFPKLLVNDIKNIPIPKNINSKEKGYIINLARKIIKIREEYSENHNINPIALESKIKAIQKKIDERFCKAYGLYDN